MWDEIIGEYTDEPDLEYYAAENKTTDATIIVFPGGGYSIRAEHEGKGYAEFLNSLGMDAFVVQYRVAPHSFPLPLLDARRSIRYVRKNAGRFGINPEKIGVMGSSAGGHLAALLSTYNKPIEFENIDEIDKVDYYPNFQVLCYPVINFSDNDICHVGSIINLIGDGDIPQEELDPINCANEKTPQAFIWHTSDDSLVNVTNSLRYGEKLRSINKDFEMHIFPNGPHGLGLSKDSPYVAKWTELLQAWLKEKIL